MALDPIVWSNSSARRWTDRISNALKKEVAIELNLVPPVCVLQVPKTPTQHKQEAYTPQIIGMGPYHHLRPDLYQMERYKLAAIKDILDPTQILNFKNVLVDKLRDIDLVVRACYNRFMDIDEETLAWIVAIDGLFLLNILHSTYGNDHESCNGVVDDTIFTRDFMMLENQIPFVVVKQIRKFLCLSFPEDREDVELISMFRRFCEVHSPLPLPANNEYYRNVNAKGTFPLHLLDLLYHLILDDRVDFVSVPIQMSSFVIKHDEEDDQDHDQDQDQDTHKDIIHNFETILEVLEPIGPRNVQKLVKPINQVVANVPWSTISGLFRKGMEDEESDNISIIPSASRLWFYAGVKCSPIHEGISRIKFDQGSSTLYLSVITMKAGSEVIIRNLMVYEAAMSKSKLEFARYINLMSGIADADEDVRLLRQSGVIKGDLTDSEISTFFSTIQRSFVKSSGSSNVDIVMDKVKKYYAQRLIVRARRRLKRNIYVSWKFLPVAVSISFVLLMIFQTFCSVYSCHNVWGNRY